MSLGALRPLAETRRDLALGSPWKSPASKPPSEGEDRFAAEPDERFFVAVEASAAQREGAQETDTLQRRLDRALRRALAGIEKKVSLLRGDAAAGDVVAKLRQQGELLKSAVASVKRGASEVRVRDFASGEEVAIPLDPALRRARISTRCSRRRARPSAAPSARCARAAKRRRVAMRSSRCAPQFDAIASGRRRGARCVRGEPRGRATARALRGRGGAG